MPDPEKPRATITGLLSSLAQGRFVDEVSTELATLVRQINHVAETSGSPKGKLTITLDIKLDRGVFEIDPGYKITPPKIVRARTIMYADREGQLVKEDPSQQSLALGPVREVPLSEVRDIGTAKRA